MRRRGRLSILPTPVTFRSFLLAPASAVSALACSAPGPAPALSKPNVLLIVIDDLNDWVGAFGGNPQTATPHLDRLAASGATVFQNAYCAGPVCGPSRAALLSGYLPHRTGVYLNPQNMLRSPLVQANPTLPEYFSHHGYTTLSSGKVFHRHPSPTGPGMDEGHWAFDHWVGAKGAGGPLRPRYDSRGRGEIVGEPLETSDGDGPGLSWGPSGPRETTKDHRTALWAAGEVGRKHGKPFFLAVGFSKPHLPWLVPQEYFDRHPLDQIKIPQYRLDDLDDVLDANGRKRFEPSADFLWVRQSEELFRRAVQAYLAATSYADDCVGVLLDALDRSPHRDNTIVVVVGDNGWHLGEKLRFRKSTLWEEATRVPLLIRAPGMTARRDCNRVVGLIDMFPTLAELCKLPPKPDLDGRSIASLLADPTLAWPHPGLAAEGPGSFAVRDERWYLIHHRDGSEELYDMASDQMQLTNLAGSKIAEVRAARERLAALLPTKWHEGLPMDAEDWDARQAKRAQGVDRSLVQLRRRTVRHSD